MNAPRIRPLPRGEPAPWFIARSTSNPLYHFHTVAGRHIVLFFVGSLRLFAQPGEALQRILGRRELFDDVRCSLFVVTLDESDAASARVQEMLPGVRVLIDSDAAIGRQFGVAAEGDAPGNVRIQPSLVLLDPTLRVMHWWLLPEDVDRFAADFCARLDALPQPLTGAAQLQAPVVIVPQVFEPEFCRELIAYYERRGG